MQPTPCGVSLSKELEPAEPLQTASMCFFFNINNFFKFIFPFIFGCAGSSLQCGLFCNCGKQGLLSIAVHGFLIAIASLVAELRL